ncbi:MAG: hypothetical protein AAGA58_04465 [Verrucomicrobiota bacterium]
MIADVASAIVIGEENDDARAFLRDELETVKKLTKRSESRFKF